MGPIFKLPIAFSTCYQGHSQACYPNMDLSLEILSKILNNSVVKKPNNPTIYFPMQKINYNFSLVGHLAKDCFHQAGGAAYELLPEIDDIIPEPQKDNKAVTKQKKHKHKKVHLRV